MLLTYSQLIITESRPKLLQGLVNGLTYTLEFFLENGYVESFNGKFKDELLNLEIFTTLEEAKVLIEQWRREYNQVRPHSSLGYRPPAPEAILSVVVT